MINKIFIGIKSIPYYILGNILAACTYDKKYLKGKYFSGKFRGLGKIGWRWVVSDCLSRIIFGINRGVPFPVSPKISISNPRNIHFHVDDLNNFQGFGNYYQAAGGGNIIIGKGCWIAPNVGLITTNHDIKNPSKHAQAKDIKLGENCWIGMNSVILPGVTIGPNTTVGAGSVVTKSYPEGFCVIAGNPAKVIKRL
ncbi:DapH/DapD/GlmU-related protein [Halobacillus aidingensis]|uniref:Transferase hexapeptide (Six repeat-containing protein) n=1 Tax=Halobacillus aidingensis TaxID=240303 RepID=A0A1H0KIY1_HALAD|nr:DapH/DapD/GlmU-related protein [Halobacillus aidingensis]SDO55908.1 transferase hexapeptide (six repeat-containing protein) [Halobacillus aidingensis]